MARTPRIWSPIDIEMIRYFSELREEAGNPSLRTLAPQLKLKHTRVGDLFNMQNGTPTLQEFIDLCLGFGKDPADTLHIILNRLEKQGVHFEKDVSTIADRIAANPDMYDLAANRDENKDFEAETPRD